MKTIYAPARAKINLYLRITGRREDGYHTLETVFQAVRLRDEIALHIGRAGGVEVRTDKRFLPSDARNIAHRAAVAFYERTGIRPSGLSIRVKKRIPVGGGMGGGSADAAAVLRALNNFHARPLGTRDLLALGLTLGADVPFCLLGGAALARGVGERLERVNALPGGYIVGCRPGVSVSTKTAFELFDDFPRKNPAPPVENMLSALKDGDLRAVCAALHNDFEGPIMARFPQIAKAKHILLQSGAAGALMTGSGSVVYGIFEGESVARRAAAELKRVFGETFITRPHAKA